MNKRYRARRVASTRRSRQRFIFATQDQISESPPDGRETIFYCYECGCMASIKTCPHDSKAIIDENGHYKGGARLMLSSTVLKKLQSEGKPIPPEFLTPEVVSILNKYYNSVEE